MTDAKQKIEELLTSQLEGNTEVFLVDLKIIPGNNIKIFVDADKGITIDKCTKINRALYKQIEEEGIFSNDDFSLEVSSPGVEEPLKLLRQYKKNIGRTVEITVKDRTQKQGKLTSVNDEGVILEENQGSKNKRTIKTTNILFDQIMHTKVLVTF